VASGGRLPGTAPPTSSKCATAIANAITWSAWKIGRISAKSQAWVPPSKASLVRNVSPGAISGKRDRMKRTCAENVPVNRVMPLVCATRSPFRSHRPQAKSSTS
jgi:hypothetical protein